jgi:hypothetical protein
MAGIMFSLPSIDTQSAVADVVRLVKRQVVLLVML